MKKRGVETEKPTGGKRNLKTTSAKITPHELPQSALQVRKRARLESERLSELFDVAAEVFLAEGFDRASTNEIARRANASKTTFYSRFPTKKALFFAVMEYRMGRVFEKVAAALPLKPPIEVTLQEFGMNIIRAALTETQVALIRMISTESRRFPELGTRFYEMGPGRGKKLLAQYLEEHSRRGSLRQYDPERMAEHFISLVIGGPVHWYVLGFQPTLLKDEKRRDHVEAAVGTFLRAYSTARSSGS